MIIFPSNIFGSPFYARWGEKEMLTPIALPIFHIIDKWEKVIDRITLVYLLKIRDDADHSAWHLAICCQKGVPSYCVSGVFDARPSRRQVEAQLKTPQPPSSKKRVRRSMKIICGLMETLRLKS